MSRLREVHLEERNRLGRSRFPLLGPSSIRSRTGVEINPEMWSTLREVDTGGGQHRSELLSKDFNLVGFQHRRRWEVSERIFLNNESYIQRWGGQEWSTPRSKVVNIERTRSTSKEAKLRQLNIPVPSFGSISMEKGRMNREISSESRLMLQSQTGRRRHRGRAENSKWTWEAYCESKSKKPALFEIAKMPSGIERIYLILRWKRTWERHHLVSWIDSEAPEVYFVWWYFLRCKLRGKLDAIARQWPSYPVGIQWQTDQEVLDGSHQWQFVKIIAFMSIASIRAINGSQSLDLSIQLGGLGQLRHCHRGRSDLRFWTRLRSHTFRFLLQPAIVSGLRLFHPPECQFVCSLRVLSPWSRFRSKIHCPVRNVCQVCVSTRRRWDHTRSTHRRRHRSNVWYGPGAGEGAAS